MKRLVSSELDFEKFLGEKRINENVTSYNSPYDIPKSFSLDQTDDDEYSLSFNYMGFEDKRVNRKIKDVHVKLIEGGNSNRLFNVIIQVPEGDNKPIHEIVEQAIKQVLAFLNTSNPREQLKRRMINTYRQDILNEIRSKRPDTYWQPK